MRHNLRHVAAAGFGLAAMIATAAQAAPSVGRRVDITGAYPGESYSQYRYYRGGYYRGGYHGNGGAVTAGILGGLAAGALIGGLAAQAAPPPAYGPPPAPAYGGPVPVGNVYERDPNWVSYCASRYRSFDPASGTYLGQDGYRYPCQ